MGEVLDQYDIDGVFFNMFGFAPRDYSGTYHGGVPVRQLPAPPLQ